MRVKRLLIRYWWFIVLLIFAGYFLTQNILSNNRRDKEMGFAQHDTQGISQIVISSTDASITLQKTQSGSWLVNRDTPASTDAINALFRVISRLRTAGPVPITVNDTLDKFINTRGITVELFSGRRLIKEYSIAYTTQLNQHNVGLMKGSRQGYRLELPGFDGNIVSLFKTEEEYWVGNLLSMPSLSSINAVEVEVPYDPEQSYRVDISDTGEYRVFNVYNGVEISEVNSARVKQFLDNLTSVPYTGIASLSSEEKAAIVYSEPDFIYNIYQKDGKIHLLKVFPIPVDEYIDELGRPVNVDLNRVYLTVSGSNQVFIANFIDLHQLLRNLLSFVN